MAKAKALSRFERDAPRRVITAKQALNCLRPGRRVHVLRWDGLLLIGIDRTRAQIMSLFRKSQISLAGPDARRLGHGLAIPEGREVLFIETDDAALAVLTASIKG